jgi:lipoprotein-anchoring transpeptidase ErfK/SrfK
LISPIFRLEWLLMSVNLTRRDFLRLAGLSTAALGAVAFRWDVWLQQSQEILESYRPDFPRQPEYDMGMLARVASKQVDIRALPSDDAPIVGNRFRDQLIHLYGEVRPEDAPKYYNTLWYRTWGGYIHSAHLQIVQVKLNDLVGSVREAGHLCEVTVPYTTAYQYNRWDGWFPWRGSRLYYSSTHWVTAIESGPNGKPWYQITSELSKTEKYLVPAEHIRIVDPSEYAPLSTNTPAEEKHVEVSLPEQTLRAFEYGNEVYSARISSGIPNYRLSPEELPTATPEGRFNLYSKMPSKHMGSVAGGPEVEENGGFTLPGVPWTCFFRSPGGYALHGTYWHNNFGLQMSHGCVNMRNEDAKWLFRWSTPVFDPLAIKDHADWERTGNGTRIVIYS